MRGVLWTLFVATGISISVAAPTKAQNYPFCLTGALNGGGYDCSFTSFQQCMATASGLAATCVESPFLSREPRPYQQQPARRRKPAY